MINRQKEISPFNFYNNIKLIHIIFDKNEFKFLL